MITRLFMLSFFLFSFVLQRKIPIYLYSYGRFNANYSLLMVEREKNLEFHLLKAGL